MIRSAVALGLIAAAVAAAACGSSSDSASTQTQAGATKGKVYPGTINVSFPFLPIVQFYPLELGADYGVFKKYGLNVKVKIVNDAAINAALKSGAVQFHITSPPLELSYAAGVPVKLVGVYGNHTQTYLAAAPGIKSVQGLVGKKIGITAPNGYSAIIAKWALYKAGVALDKAKFVPMGMTMPSQALVSGLVDAVDSDTTQLLLAQKNKPGVTPVEDFTPVLWPSGQIWGHSSWMAAHKEETAVFLQAFNAAVVRWNNDPVTAKKVIAKYNNTKDTKVIDALYKATQAEFNKGDNPVEAPSYETESFISKVLRTTGFPAATDANAKEGKIWTSDYWKAAFAK
jgi:ABC-type nitrate/sulfonate/bicarbonate transport system substrate-binding protein